MRSYYALATLIFVVLALVSYVMFRVTSSSEVVLSREAASKLEPAFRFMSDGANTGSYYLEDKKLHYVLNGREVTREEFYRAFPNGRLRFELPPQ